MTEHPVDMRPYEEFVLRDGDTVMKCRYCLLPIWEPHRDGCPWWVFEGAPQPKPALEPNEELVVLVAVMIAGWLLGLLIVGFA